MKKSMLKLRIEELKEDVQFYQNKVNVLRSESAKLKELNEDFESRVKDLLCCNSGLYSNIETLTADLESQKKTIEKLDHTNSIYFARLNSA